VRDDYNKLFFTILDYTGSATRLFADPEFDGEPVVLTQEEVDEEGRRRGTIVIKDWTPSEDGQPTMTDDSEGEPRKFYVEGGEVEIVTDTVFDLDQDGRRIRAISYTEYTGREVRTMFTSMSELRSKWSNAQQRKAVIEALEEKGISLEHLLEVGKNPDADPFDLLCNLAFNAPIRTRRERAERLTKEEKGFLEKFKPQAREILSEVLDKYIEFGATQLNDVNVLKVPPISMRGNVLEIAGFFGGPDEMRSSLDEMQTLLYEL
jgi:type I restriction enzyme R subunit